MIVYIMTEAELQLAHIIWEHEPISSGELVKLAAEQLNWKKPTTYTVLRKICNNGLFQNENTIVTSLISQSEYIRMKGERYLAENYSGSLPGFVAAFMERKKLSKRDIQELSELIDTYKEKEDDIHA